MAREIIIYSYAKRNILGKVILYSSDLEPNVLVDKIEIDISTKIIDANYNMKQNADVISENQINMRLKEYRDKK